MTDTTTAAIPVGDQHAGIVGYSTDAELLRQCIASGQVEADQIVSHAARCAGLDEQQWLRLKAYLPVRLSRVAADASELRTLLIRGAVRLREWHAKYGEHQPQWLPPAGDVRWLEDVETVLAQTPAGVAPVETPSNGCAALGGRCEWPQTCEERGSCAYGVLVSHEGEIVVTWAGDEIVLVSRQDDEGRVLKVLAEKGKPPSASGVDLPDGAKE